ncbi:MAG TPA: zinc ribbon domain-containing protein [Limnochordia bacterium]|jgi:hypothetical protein|nr:zinc ribbon domain-containing protein [Limnochordia bacterium]
MFFIGIFGVQSKTKTLKTEVGIACPICGAYDRYAIMKTFTYFHIFFLPLWKWNKRYHIQTRCCQRRCALNDVMGARIEAGEAVEIVREHVTKCEQSQGVRRLCSTCRKSLEPTHRFCPYCGTET